ncbi:MAG: acetolactate synthase [Calditrichaeota bacterium]|nr:MAG: acetolactate synthase [Calditrichota bacterium]
MQIYNGGVQVAQVLKKEGITHLFTLCGGHIAPIYLAAAQMGIRVIDMRHEQAAAHAADAWARITRQIGVAVVTAGPGVTDAVTGVANAYFADSPVLLIGGSAPVAEWDRGALQEMNQVDLFKPITKWAKVVTDPKRIAEYTAMAIRIALSGKPGPVYLELPIDILMETMDPKEAIYYEPYRVEALSQPDAHSIETASTILHECEKPVIIGGSNVYWDHAEEALDQFVKKLQSPVYLNGMGRGCIPSHHPNFFSLSRKKALKEADAVIVVGTPLDFRLAYGKFNPSAKVIMVDRDESQMGKNRPVHVGIVGNVKLSLEALSANIRQGPERKDWFAALRQEETERRERINVLAKSDKKPINHYRLCQAIADFIDDETIVVGDGGDIVACGARVIPVNKPGNWMDPGPFGCLGVGPSFAIAAKLAHPEKKVLILHGDGSFGLNGMEFDTAVRHNIPIVSVIGNDAGWGQIRNPQVAILGKEASVATDLALTHYEKIVEALGGYGEFVEEPAQIIPALERAFASGKPACVNVVLDPDTLKGEVNVMRGLSI